MPNHAGHQARGKSGGALGNALANNFQKKRHEMKNDSTYAVGVIEQNAAKSVLEQGSLDDFLAQAELSRQTFESQRGQSVIIESAARLIEKGVPLSANMEAEERAALARNLTIPIPRRPRWHEGITTEDLSINEGEAFVEWRRGLAELEETQGLAMTPFEKNLDFWRQLWRCVEKSDILVQIIDARDPLFYRCEDLERYVKEVGATKQHLLLINKADFLTPALRKRWAAYFAERGVDVVFFSALRELHRQKRLPHEQAYAATRLDAAEALERAVPDDDDDELNEEDQRTKRTAALLALHEEEDEQDVSDTIHGEAAAFNPPARGSTAGVVEIVSGEDSVAAEEPVAAGAASLAGQSCASSPVAAADQVSPHEHGDTPDVLDCAELIEALRSRLDRAMAGKSREGSASDPASEGSSAIGVAGFVGYPNVGKSSVINAIFGTKKVSMSRQPGKTKHLQTLEVSQAGKRLLTLCDCPGLVFPSVVATKAHLCINGTASLEELRDWLPPMRLVVEKVGLAALLTRYGCAAFADDGAKRRGEAAASKQEDVHTFLSAFAVARQHFLRVGVPDENWAARKTLKDFVTGELCHCELPADKESTGASSSEAQPASANPQEVNEDGPEDEDDFGDLDSFLSAGNAAGGKHTRQMTKRKERQMAKIAHKGHTGSAQPGAKVLS